jgi:hypothetical protein
VIADELAFWRSEDSANPDAEVIAAIRPGLASVRRSMLIGISSPYARRGVLWDAFRKHHGNDAAPILVWQADTRSMNPTVDEAIVAAAYADDEAAASAEWGANFRRDVASYIPREAVEECVVPLRRELPPLAAQRYIAFIDPSGGSSDSMTLAIAHSERRGGIDFAVLDVIREAQPPFSPENVVGDFAATLDHYSIRSVTGDRYGGEFVREPFARRGISYRLAEKPKSDIYRDFLPLVNSRRAELLDHARLIVELSRLERRTARGGRDSIDHGPNQHDDVANAVAGALVSVGSRRRNLCGFGWGPREIGEAQAEHENSILPSSTCQ